ncbi:MAG: FTR1 family iron permease [Bifidobacteriaceae bacterium]|jgi:high-affinity iron transporter|nr:FTR1 family iron permease [Bifidobacteriaceae bacterium]
MIRRTLVVLALACGLGALAAPPALALGASAHISSSAGRAADLPTSAGRLADLAGPADGIGQGAALGQTGEILAAAADGIVPGGGPSGQIEAAAPRALPAADDAPATWADVATDMVAVTDNAYDIYLAGDAETAKDRIDDAYYGSYEALGFEKIVMAHLSGDRAAAVEYQFAQIKKSMLAGDPKEDIRGQIDQLQRMLREDAAALDGDSADPVQTFVSALVIILREGFEAILVVGAIIAYLVKSGNAAKLKTVWLGVGLALAASVALAFAVGAITQLAGANQEIIEGVTVLIAVVMLIWVSNWIFAKADAAAWTKYVKDQADASLSRGSTLSLTAVAFLAVFREGAEVILFFQALRTQASDHANMLWLGLGVGLAILVVVYLLIRHLSIKIPMRPFFLSTSILLALLAFTFAGSGVKELQEGNAMSATAVPHLASVDLLGFYPTVETLSAQGLVLAVIVGLFVLGGRRSARAAKPGAEQVGDAAQDGGSSAASTRPGAEAPVDDAVRPPSGAPIVGAPPAAASQAAGGSREGRAGRDRADAGEAVPTAPERRQAVATLTQAAAPTGEPI